MGGKKIQAGVLEKVRRKLEVIKEESICKSKPQSVLMDKTTRGRERWDGKYQWLGQWVVKRIFKDKEAWVESSVIKWQTN